MALLEFECEGCGHRFEELVRGEGAPSCPECGEEARRLYSAIARTRAPRMSRAAMRESDSRRAEREVVRKEAHREQRRKR